MLCLLVLAMSLSASSAAQSTDEPQFQDGVLYVLNQFDTHPVVALGERHGLQVMHDFYLSLIQHPDFPKKVNDIVVEYGNAHHQALLDRYIAGEHVERDEIRKVWRDLAVSTMLQYGADQFEDFFAAVREVNQGLPTSQRLRVLAGGPPINWQAVKQAEEVASYLKQRDAHYAEVVVEQVLAKDRKALLISGSTHLKRQNVPARIEQHQPGSTYIIQFFPGFGPRNPEFLPRLSDVPNPAIADIRNTWLGLLDLPSISPDRGNVMLRRIPTDAPLEEGEIIVTLTDQGQKKIETVVNGQKVDRAAQGNVTKTPGNNTQLQGPPDNTARGDNNVKQGNNHARGGNAIASAPKNATPQGSAPFPMYVNLPPGRYKHTTANEGKTLQDMTDAILYFGPLETLAPQPIPEEIWQDDAFWEELDRRSILERGQPLDPMIRASKGQNDVHH